MIEAIVLLFIGIGFIIIGIVRSIRSYKQDKINPQKTKPWVS